MIATWNTDVTANGMHQDMLVGESVKMLKCESAKGERQRVSNNCRLSQISLNLSSLKKRISFSLCVGNQLYVSTGNLKNMYLDKEKIKSYIWESFQENIMIEIRECETIALTKIKHFSRFAE